MVNIETLQDLKEGDFYSNKTRKYLFPCMNHYGDSLLNCLRKFNNLAFVGIDDEEYPNIIKEPALFLIMKINQMRLGEFNRCLDELRVFNFLIDDYTIGDVSSRFHGLIIKIPEMCTHAYDYFSNGQYSKMYDNREVKKVFQLYATDNATPMSILKRNKNTIDAYQVVTKDNIKKIELEKYLSDDIITVEIPDDNEYEFLPKVECEVFRYKKLCRLPSTERIYVNRNL